VSLSSYFSNVGNHKLLTREEEVELAKRIKAGDKSARDQMVNANLRLAISIAKK
jgi:RNA polymerase primary sigma factor